MALADQQRRRVGDQYQNILSAAFFRLKMVDPDIEASSHMEINPSQNSTIIADGPTQTDKQNYSSPSNSTEDSTEVSPFIGEVEEYIISHPPSDKYHLVYLIFLLHGVGILLPWNTFLTIATDYYIGYKFNETRNLPYTNNFFNFLTACSQIPNLLLSMMNLFAIIKGGLSRRINLSLAVILLICLVTIFFIYVDTRSWPFGFFLVTMLTVVILNSANGIYQNSIWGLIADFPARFTNAVILGCNVCGIFVTCVYILILLMESGIKITATIFFGTAFIIVISCLMTFHMLPKFPFYRYHTAKAIKARDKQVEASKVEGVQIDFQNPTLKMYVDAFKESWPQLLDVFMVFFVTLSLFPTVFLQIYLYPPGRKYDIFIYGDLRLSQSIYLQLSIFLNFNLFATIGNFIANYIQWPSPKHLRIAVFARLVFIPLFWLCNYTDIKDRHFVLITSEYSVILLITLMSITHGYYSSLAMMYAPKQVDKSKARIVGMMSGFFLVLGISCGIVFTFLEPTIVKIFA